MTTSDNADTSVFVTKTVEDDVMTSHSGHGYKYWLGVGLVLYAGLASALANVVQVILIKEKSNITTNHHVIIGGEIQMLTTQCKYYSYAFDRNLECVHIPGDYPLVPQQTGHGPPLAGRPLLGDVAFHGLPGAARLLVAGAGCVSAAAPHPGPDAALH